MVPRLASNFQMRRGKILAVAGLLSLSQQSFCQWQDLDAFMLDQVESGWWIPQDRLLVLGHMEQTGSPVAHEEAFAIEGLSRQAAEALSKSSEWLDLVQQAGPGAVVVNRIRTRPQKERPLQGIDGAVHRTGRGERSEIVALHIAGPAVLFDLRIIMRGRDQNIGKALIVAQQHVEFRLELFDQVLFKQQRLGLCFRGQKHHRRGV